VALCCTLTLSVIKTFLLLDALVRGGSGMRAPLNRTTHQNPSIQHSIASRRRRRPSHATVKVGYVKLKIDQVLLHSLCHLAGFFCIGVGGSALYVDNPSIFNLPRSDYNTCTSEEEERTSDSNRRTH